MRLSAIDAIQHGLLNLRANWQLVLIQAAQSLLVLVIAIAGVVPIVAVLGFSFVRGVIESLDSEDVSELSQRVMEVGLPLLAALLVTSLIWTIAFVVYCYIQGGMLGVLAAGEGRAQREGVRWPSFREFSMKAFFGFAEGLTWPIFWLINLFFLIATGVLLVFAVFGAGLLALFANRGFGAGSIAVGCFGFAILFLIMVFLSIWMQVSLAELATGTRGALAASRAGLAVLGKRLPGLALLFLLLFVVSMALAIAVTPVSLALETVLRDRLTIYLVGQAFLTLLQWFVSGVLTLGFAGALIALVNGEREAPA